MPRSSQGKIAGWIGDSLKICVKSAPEKGKANRAAQEILATTLGLPKNNVRIVSGFSSTRKLVEISDLSEAEIRRRLGAL
ncbi:MAG TPA: DUF167 domain-containing protein [Burkholderiales bacterium]|nr:DUF167 domain-containing protein [Burkholderiales bacterium]